MVKICENCNNEIEENSKFCSSCGLKVSDDEIRICPVCETKNNPNGTVH